jgi:sugar O-acyltransferase (sialic acid O-acetyltransferase NeuD family)
VTPPSLIILGAGGHARVVAEAWVSTGKVVAGFLAPRSGESTERPVRILGDDELLDDRAFVDKHDFAVGVGAPALRRMLGQRILEAGGGLPPIVHASAVVAADVELGRGCQLMAGSVVNTGAVVRDFAIINTGATVDHDCIVGDAVHICPGVHLGGTVHCGEAALVGIGASVIQGVTIGAGAVVGSGAAVIRDVADGSVVVGCPARPIRDR